MSTPYLIALGGNALQARDSSGSHQDQFKAALAHLKPIAKLAQDGHPLVITHGNGPQSGALLLQQEAAKNTVTHQPLHSLVAMTQGQIGYILESALQELLPASINVTTLLTMVEVDPNDKAFQHPTKPIGPFYTNDQLSQLDTTTATYKEDAGRGYRRVVPSPTPVRVIGKNTITKLLKPYQIVIAGGGGGIPVVSQNGRLTGIDAVIDKDFTSLLLARELGIPHAIILTAVPQAYIHFNTPDKKALSEITADQAQEYLDQGHFGKGSMGPKIAASIKFVKNGGRRATITDADHLKDALKGTSGTHIIHP